MNQFLALYLLTSAIQILPGILVAVSLLYGMPFPYLRNMINAPLRVNNRPRNINLSQLEQALLLFDSDIIDDMARFSFTSSIFQITTVISTCVTVYYDIPLPFVGNVNDSGSEDNKSKLMSFLLTTGALQLIPMILLFLAFVWDVQIPFLPGPEEREQYDNVMTGFQRSQVGASYRLIRFKNSRHTIIFVRLSEEHFGRVSKFVFIQRNGVGGMTQCFLHDEANRTLEPVIPVPLTIAELEEIFDFEDN